VIHSPKNPTETSMGDYKNLFLLHNLSTTTTTTKKQFQCRKHTKNEGVKAQHTPDGVYKHNKITHKK